MILFNQHRSTMKKLSQQQIDEAITRYGAGESYQMIGESLCVSGNAIRGLLTRRCVAARDLSESHRVLACNHNYFNEPMDEAHAYWIGFILADGNLTEKSYGRSRQVSVGLGIVDIGHLEKLRNALNSDHKILTSKRDGVNRICHLRISSTELFNSLLEFNVEPRKSARHKFSERIPTDMLKHYFRGYFDGNGGISRHKASKWSINNTASEEFLNRFIRWISDQIGGHDTRAFFGDGIHRAGWAGTHRCREILALMYQDATVFLDRKMALYQEICEEANASPRGPYNRK